MNLRSLLSEDSGQAMTEYVLVSSAVVFGMIVFLNTEVLSILPGGVYKSIYLMLKGMILNAAIPIP